MLASKVPTSLPRARRETMGLQENMFHLIGALVGGIMIGAFCGVISLIVGIIKERKVLGFIGFFASIVFGVFMTTVLHQPAFFSMIPSAIFAGIIFITAPKKS